MNHKLFNRMLKGINRTLREEIKQKDELITRQECEIAILEGVIKELEENK